MEIAAFKNFFSLGTKTHHLLEDIEKAKMRFSQKLLSVAWEEEDKQENSGWLAQEREAEGPQGWTVRRALPPALSYVGNNNIFLCGQFSHNFRAGRKL